MNVTKATASKPKFADLKFKRF